MNTYSESRNSKPFDWNDFLDKAVRNQISIEEKREASLLAASWVTCACGNQCDSIPRNDIGMPYDIRLQSLGADFYGCIAVSDWERAKILLGEIEQRSKELLYELEIVRKRQVI